ncbi:hypothetical protein [Goodfellowiella coeruleoviolacea]|uniref:hypothetical protein n=1 Tax=Goodfellowiella coeruleoviolacea TaxID=334858 RepID=UPI0020A378A2|nr:hypothetical protein [Goodfellowiella coeruleoviolacea]
MLMLVFQGGQHLIGPQGIATLPRRVSGFGPSRRPTPHRPARDRNWLITSNDTPSWPAASTSLARKGSQPRVALVPGCLAGAANTSSAHKGSQLQVDHQTKIFVVCAANTSSAHKGP